MIDDALAQLVHGQDLEGDAMASIMEAILRGEVSDAQIAGLAVALRMKGETAWELAAAARVLRERCQVVDLEIEGPTLDTCGTGGDGAGTFNISTVSGVVAAAAGTPVAKHGNRAVSSRAGSADVLEALGVRIDLAPDEVAACVREVGIGFLFAPTHHGALRHAAAARRALRMRTFFNLLGPLANPAGVRFQLVGVYESARVRQMAEVLGLLGVEGAWVVHGAGGLDEVSPSGPTEVAVLSSGNIRERLVCPEDFGCEPVSLDAIVGGDARENAAIARAVLSGKKSPHRTAVVINAAAALCAAGAVEGPREGAERVRQAIDSGAALACLERWVQRTGG